MDIFKNISTTTILGIAKLVLRIVGVGTVASGTVTVTAPDGSESVTLPPLGQKWYVYIPFILSMVVSFLQSKATPDLEKKS
jgi:hypothetical protein